MNETDVTEIHNVPLFYKILVLYMNQHFIFSEVLRPADMIELEDLL